MKIVEKPTTKHMLRRNVGNTLREETDSAGSPVPATYEIYPGTSGKTQGDRNEMAPATKAVRIPILEISNKP
jgi:hypothetical protein